MAALVRESAEKIARGEPSALSDLFELAGSRLLRFSQTLTRSRQDAEDALQCAMIRVAESPRHLSAARHPWAYLLQIVRNESLKIINRRRPTQVLLDADEAPFTISSNLEREEARQQVRDAIRKLPPEQAEVVTLKIWEGMTFQEIALVLSESANTAASRYRYAMAKLSRYLQPLAEEVPCD